MRQISQQPEFGIRPLWVSSSLSAVYHLGGWLRPEAAIQRLCFELQIVDLATAARSGRQEQHVFYPKPPPDD